MPTFADVLLGSSTWQTGTRNANQGLGHNGSLQPSNTLMRDQPRKRPRYCLRRTIPQSPTICHNTRLQRNDNFAWSIASITLPLVVLYHDYGFDFHKYKQSIQVVLIMLVTANH